MRTMTKRAGWATAAATLAVALSAPTAWAATIPGHYYGETLYGTNYSDTIYGYGGADLIYGYGGNDTLYGGNEYGWGDKILVRYGNDSVYGNNGDDGLYGDSGDDGVYGGYGRDLVQGGYGYDFLDGGPNGDQINAREGQKDTIVIRPNDYDTIYYDRGLDVFYTPTSLQGTAAKEGARAMSAEEAMKAGKVKLVAEKPPEGLFEHTGKVLIGHKGEEMLVAEKAVKGHMDHGDKILDPTGRAGVEEGRR